MYMIHNAPSLGGSALIREEPYFVNVFGAFGHWVNRYSSLGGGASIGESFYKRHVHALVHSATFLPTAVSLDRCWSFCPIGHTILHNAFSLGGRALIRESLYFVHAMIAVHWSIWFIRQLDTRAWEREHSLGRAFISFVCMMHALILFCYLLPTAVQLCWSFRPVGHIYT